MSFRNAALRFTVEDYLSLPEGGPRYQLIDGDLILSPAPSTRHQRILARLFKAILLHVEALGLGEVLFAPVDVYLSDTDVVQPDIVYVSHSNRRRLRDDGIHGTPDLVVEVLSTNPSLDLRAKRRLYARASIPEYWVVDPETNIVHFYRLRENASRPLRTLRSRDVLESVALTGLRLPLAPILAR